MCRRRPGGQELSDIKAARDIAAVEVDAQPVARERTQLIEIGGTPLVAGAIVQRKVSATGDKPMRHRLERRDPMPPPIRIWFSPASLSGEIVDRRRRGSAGRPGANGRAPRPSRPRLSVSRSTAMT